MGNVKIKNLENPLLHPIDVAIGEKLRLIRLIANVTQTQLAEQTDLTFQQIQKYEKGLNRISGSRMWQICKVLGADISVLFEDLPPTTGDGMENKFKNIVTSQESAELLSYYYRIKSRTFARSVLNMLKEFPKIDYAAKNDEDM